jgi:GT2 family glycosyltransferase
MTVPVFEGQAPEASAGAAPTLAVKLQRVRDRRGDYESVTRPPGATSWDVDFGIGACQVFRRRAFDEVGALDESLYWAEVADFCLRLREAGWRVVQTDATRVVHPPRRSSRRPLSRRGMRHAVAVVRLLWRHRGYRRAVPDASAI